MVIKDNSITIKITDEVIQKMKHYIQWNYNDTEAGGILVGWENVENSNVVIDKATVPMKGDIREKTRFLRHDVGHIEFYKNLYINSEEIYAYYGEWHTHPEDIPHYSIIDLKNWRKIAKEDSKDSQYHIILGRKKLSIWQMKKEQLLPKLMGEVNWNEINYKKNER